MIDQRTAPYAALVLRVTLGVMFIAHSLVLKHFTYTLPGTAQFFESIGLPGALAYLTFWAELLGGIALVAGFATRWVVARADSDPDRRDLGAHRQRLGVQRRQRRLGVSCVPDRRLAGAVLARRWRLRIFQGLQSPQTARSLRMKIYYSPGACSLSPHIVARELGLSFDLKKVNTKDKTIEGGGDYWKVNPRGYVPALELDNGQILTEGPAIVQYLADQKPESGLAPKNGSIERYRLQEWLNFLTSEIHKQFSPLFKPNTPEDYKPIVKENLAARFDWLDKQLAGKDYLTGKQFTVADAYLFVLLGWTRPTQIDLARWPNLAAFHKRVGARPKVQEALQAEGLLKKAA